MSHEIWGPGALLDVGCPLVAGTATVGMRARRARLGVDRVAIDEAGSGGFALGLHEKPIGAKALAAKQREYDEQMRRHQEASERADRARSDESLRRQCDECAHPPRYSQPERYDDCLARKGLTRQRCY